MRTEHHSERSAVPGSSEARYWRAVLARDGRADGTFFFAVRSTQVYCRPSCPARRPLRANTLFFENRHQAEKEGYRPCRRCHPDEIPAGVLIVERAARVLEAEVDEP